MTDVMRRIVSECKGTNYGKKSKKGKKKKREEVQEEGRGWTNPKGVVVRLTNLAVEDGVGAMLDVMRQAFVDLSKMVSSAEEKAALQKAAKGVRGLENELKGIFE